MRLWRPILGVLLVLLAADASLASNAASVAPKDKTTAKKDTKAHTAADTINYYTIIIRGDPPAAGGGAPAPNSAPAGSDKPKELVVDSMEEVERLAKKWRQQKQQQQQQQKQQPKKAVRTPGDSKDATPAPDEILKDFLESHSVFGPDTPDKQIEEEPLGSESSTGESSEETLLPDLQTSNPAEEADSSSGSGSREKEDSSSSQDSSKDADADDSRLEEEPDQSSSSSNRQDPEDSSSRTRARETDRPLADEEQPQRSSQRKRQEEDDQEEKTSSRKAPRPETRGKEERPAERGDSEADTPRRRRQQQQADDSPADDGERETKQRSSRSKVRDSDESERSKTRETEGSSRAKDIDSAESSSRVRRQQPEEESSEDRGSRRADSKQRSDERADDRQQQVDDRSSRRVADSKQRPDERDSRPDDSKQRSDEPHREREAEEAPRDRDTDRQRSYSEDRREEEEESQQQTRDSRDTADDDYRRGYDDGSDDRRSSSKEGRGNWRSSSEDGGGNQRSSSSKDGREETPGSYPRLEEDGAYFKSPELHSTCLQVFKATGDASGLSTYDLRCCDHKDDPKVCMKTEDPTYTSFSSHQPAAAAAPASPKSMMEVLKSHSSSKKVATCAFTPTDTPCPASDAGHPSVGCQAFKGTCMLAKSASECGCPSGTGTGVLLELTAFAYRAAALSCSPVFTTAQPESFYGGGGYYSGGGPDPLDDGPPYLGVGVVMKGSGHVLADSDLRARMTFISGFGVPTQPAPIYGHRRRQLLASSSSGGSRGEHSKASIMNEAVLRARHVGHKAPTSAPRVSSGMSGLGLGWRSPTAGSHSKLSSQSAVTPMYGPYSLQGPYSSRQPPMAFTPAPSTPLPVPDLPFLLGGRMIIQWIAAPSR